MFRIFLIISFTLITVNLMAQNLVPNPSFEEYMECPDGIYQINKLVSWGDFNWNASSPTPDYFHACSPTFMGIPDNAFGSQCPITGKAYCGIYTTFSLTENYSEYLGVKLITPLDSGNTYYISFKVSLSDESERANNNLGVLFTNNTFFADTINFPIIKINFAHFYTDSIIFDSIGWVTISGTFLADTIYEYLVIGNFFYDTVTMCIPLDTIFNCTAYYFVDDICVSTDSLTCIDITTKIIDFSADTTIIQTGKCINFAVNTIVNYDFYKWQFKGASPLTSNDSMPTNICYDTVGNYSVILIVSDSSGCGDTITKTDYITVSSNTSIIENKLQNRIEIYPVPVKDFLLIKSDNDKDINVKIYNLLGELVYEKKKLIVNKNKIDIFNFSNGIYFVKLQSNKNIIMRKLIIN